MFGKMQTRRVLQFVLKMSALMLGVGERVFMNHCRTQNLL